MLEVLLNHPKADPLHYFAASLEKLSLGNHLYNYSIINSRASAVLESVNKPYSCTLAIRNGIKYHAVGFVKLLMSHPNTKLSRKIISECFVCFDRTEVRAWLKDKQRRY